MPHVFRFLIWAGIVGAAAGCPSTNRSASETGDKSDGGNAAPDESVPYHLKQHNVTIRLPNSKWKERGKPGGFVVSFYSSYLGAPMLAGVASVKRETEEQFAETVSGFKKMFAEEKRTLVAPSFEEGTNARGNRYVLATLCEKASPEVAAEYVYLAGSVVWIKDRGETVTTVFEGHGKYESRVFKEKERAAFERSARVFCLSPE